MTNGLRNEHGALIGGLGVLDYNQGHEDFASGAPPPDVTSRSYDLGRQRAAEKAEAAASVDRWLREQAARTDAALRDTMPPEMYAEYRRSIERIGRRSNKS